MNMIVLFSLLLALGIVVDDAIVVIENTHRIFDNGKTDIIRAAKTAAGEVFLPVLSGTLTTLAPFIPLAFWKGVIGEFMFYLPITLIITLMASLLVAYIINPVFAAAFMKPHREQSDKAFTKGNRITVVILLSLALLFYISGNTGMGNFIVTLLLLFLFSKYVLTSVIRRFQERTWPAFQERYRKILSAALSRPYAILGGTLVLFFLSFILVGVRSPKVVFFPKADPNFVYVYITLPVGTDQSYTNEVTKEVEARVNKVLGKGNPIVSSVLANVTIGVTDPQDEDQGSYPNRGRVGISFVPFSKRNGQSTAVYLEKIRAAVKNIPGTQITVDQEQAGPPVSLPIKIEVRGDKFEDLVSASSRLKRYLDSVDIPGVEELKSDLQTNKPEIVFNIDRERANREGISTGQVGMELRTAVFGKEISKFRDENDEYPIQLRYMENQRNDIEALRNLKITFRDMNMNGMIRDIPLSSFADVQYTDTYGGIKRKGQKRVVTLSSNVLGDFNPNEVVAQVEETIRGFKVPSGVEIKMTGEQEEQQETMSFLGTAMLISLGLIFLILVTQFNSVSKTLIILSEIIFSIIVVLLGVAIFKMQISIVMTGIGIVALAGIVVRNGILLVEFTDLLREQGYSLKEAIVEAGRTRMTPVILTATATILGLVPLAVGLNIDFVTLFSEFRPNIYFGGDNVAFWGPLSWTMIFGLGFATFLTLILVPVMYMITENLKSRLRLEKELPAVADGHMADKN
jgi:multidrug efflux pump